MNKTKLKAIRALSQRLPTSYQIIKHSDYKLGSQVIEDGDNHKMESIDADKIYKSTGLHIRQINHQKKIRKAFRYQGEKGIIEYIKWLQLNNINFNNKYSEIANMKVENVDEGIMDVIGKGVKGFWKNLIMFLFSFISAFSKEKVGG